MQRRSSYDLWDVLFLAMFVGGMFTLLYTWVVTL